MPDVVALAKDRRARLAAEIAKLDEFIQMAEMLVKYGASRPGAAADPRDQARERQGSAVVHSMPRA